MEMTPGRVSACVQGVLSNPQMMQTMMQNPMIQAQLQQNPQVSCPRPLIPTFVLVPAGLAHHTYNVNVDVGLI
jgi:hypothetical protein